MEFLFSPEDSGVLRQAQEVGSTPGSTVLVTVPPSAAHPYSYLYRPNLDKMSVWDPRRRSVMAASLLTSKIAVLKWRDFAYQGTFGNVSRDIFGCHSVIGVREGATGI